MFKGKLLITLLLFTTVFAELDIGPLTQLAIILGAQRSFLHRNNLVMENPHLKPFEKNYFTELQSGAYNPVQVIATQAELLKKSLKKSFPYAGYSSLDKNLYNRFSKENVENEKIRKIGSLLDELKHMKTEDTPAYQQVNPQDIADLKLQIKKTEKARRNNALRLPHTPAIARPYEDGKEPIAKLSKRIDELQKNIAKDMTAPTPSQEEIAVLRRLNEKMDVIARHVRAQPTVGMQEHILVQSQMLSGLADLMRHMANAVDDEHREAFLYQLHSLLHFHGLQDQPEIVEFEHELAKSVATGSPFTVKTAALRDGYDRHEALRQRNLAEAKAAQRTAAQMKNYGQELVDKSKEMQQRVAMMERAGAVPEYQRKLTDSVIYQRTQE